MSESLHSPRPRRVLLAAGAVALVLVLGLVVVALLLVRGRDAERASVDEAVDRFRASTVPGATTVGRPAQGVYTATGSGSERLSFQTTGQSIGPTLPATVTWTGDDCWDFRLDFNANHSQTWRYCQEDDGVVERGGSVFQRFDLVVAQPESRSTSTCDPPNPTVQRAAEVGRTWATSCVVTLDTGVTSEETGTTTFEGNETLVVDGREVATGRFRSDRSYSSGQEGRGRYEDWYALDSGLPIRSRWTLEITSASPIGTVTYLESGEWALDGLVPVG